MKIKWRERRWLVGLFLLSIGTHLLTSCAEWRQFTETLPGTIGRTAPQIPPYSRERLGLPSVEQYVNQVAATILQSAQGEKGVPSTSHVTVLKTSRVHSAANLGAPEITITRGFLNILMNEAELACVLAHELGHQAWNRAARSSHAGSAGARQEEADADAFGAKICQRAGYDPHALLAVLDRCLNAVLRVHGSLRTVALDEAEHLTHRITSLRQHLTQKGMTIGQGRIDQENYRRHMAALHGIESGDAINEIAPGGAEIDRQKIAALQTELKGYAVRHEQLPPGRFYEIMAELSRLAQRYGWRGRLSNTSSSYQAESPAHFLKALVSQENTLSQADAIAPQIDTTIAMVGRIGVGFVPVVNDVVDLYEFFHGYEFGSNRRLTSDERVLSAVGLLIGNGKLYREAAQGIAQALQVARRTSNVCDPALIRAGEVLRRAETEVVENAIKQEQRGIRHAEDLIKRETAVLGKFPEYLEKANALNARRFNIPANVWAKMSEVERWAANQKFLDRAIARGDEFILARRINNVAEVFGAFRKELDYLTSKGYRLSSDGSRMIKDAL